MESYLEGTRILDQLARPLPINGAVLIEKSDHNAVGAALARLVNVAAHDLKFRIRVAEVGATRTDHDGNVDASAAPNRFEQTGTRSQPSLNQSLAKFKAIRAGLFGRQRRFDGVDADFDDV
jgi:hypothetical protein